MNQSFSICCEEDGAELGDIKSVEICCFCYVTDVIFEGESWVK